MKKLITALTLVAATVITVNVPAPSKAHADLCVWQDTVVGFRQVIIGRDFYGNPIFGTPEPIVRRDWVCMR